MIQSLLSLDLEPPAFGDAGNNLGSVSANENHLCAGRCAAPDFHQIECVIGFPEKKAIGILASAAPAAYFVAVHQNRSEAKDWHSVAFFAIKTCNCKRPHYSCRKARTTMFFEGVAMSRQRTGGDVTGLKFGRWFVLGRAPTK